MAIFCRAILITLFLFAPDAPAAADMALDKVVVQFGAGGMQRDDIEVLNAGGELLYLVVEPREVLEPGGEGEQRVERRDPEELGLLVSPNRLVIEPGARRVVRLSLLRPPSERDRIWRVAFRPVVGETAAETTALRVLTAYNVLVMAYPPAPQAELVAERSGQRLALENRGNSNALLFDGRQCDAAGQNCRELPTRRLYAGNRWELELPYGTPARWRLQTAEGVGEASF